MRKTKEKGAATPDTGSDQALDEDRSGELSQSGEA